MPSSVSQKSLQMRRSGSQRSEGAEKKPHARASLVTGSEARERQPGLGCGGREVPTLHLQTVRRVRSARTDAPISLRESQPGVPRLSMNTMYSNIHGESMPFEPCTLGAPPRPVAHRGTGFRFKP